MKIEYESRILEVDTISVIKKLEELNAKKIGEWNYVRYVYNTKPIGENKRIRNILNNVELDIDSWPGIPTYIEIEGKNEKEVKETISLLKIFGKEVTSLDVEGIYLKYGYKKNI